MTWGSWHLPIGFELAVTAVFAALMLTIAVREFSKTD